MMNKTKIKLLFSTILFSSFAVAVSTSEVSQNLDDLVTKINQVNKDLQKKQSLQKNLNGAINDSNDALTKSGKILIQLKKQKNLNESQLNEIKQSLPVIQASTQQVEENVKTAMTKIYMQLKFLENNSDSVMTVNDTLQNTRKTQYLIEILKLEQTKYQNLQTKLSALNQANLKLVEELAQLDRELADHVKQQQQLQLAKKQEQSQVQILGSQIEEEQQQLTILKRNRAELNRLLAAIAATEIEAKQADKSNNRTASLASSKSDTTDENNSPFFNRTLAKPLNATIATPYGANRHGLKNNGVLYSAINQPVYSISSGKVMYNGELPSFGQVIVIDHGDNYMAVYGGIIDSNVNRGQIVKVGQLIANSGNAKNQPLGGVYFELRHYGKPVNPNALVNY